MLPDILRLEAERFAETSCALNAENLAVERQIVLAERLQRITNKAYGDAYERIFGAMFPTGSPSRLLPIGLAADVQRISVDDCRQFIAAHYLASNVNVAIVGAVDPALIQRPLEELLGSFGPGHGPEPAVDEATAECSRQIVPSHLDSKIFLAYALPPQGSRDYELARLAGYLLGGGATARLPLSVSHGRPLVSAAVVKTFGRAHGSSVGVIECPVVAGVDRDAVVVSVDAATSRPATDDELDRVKTSYLAERIGETDSIAERADGISLALQLHGSPRPFFDHPAAVAAVTTADITRGLSFWAGSSRRFELVYLGD
jgi:predicted Zn-dependent peptidase